MLNNYKYLDDKFIENNINKKYAHIIFNILENTIYKINTEILLEFEEENNQAPNTNLTSILLFLGESYEIFKDKELYNKIVYKYMVYAKKMIEEYHNYMSNSLYGGLTDFAIAVYSVTLNNEMYLKFLNTLNLEIINRVFYQISKINPSDKGVCASQYDVIYGLAGIGNYLMNFRNQEEYRLALKEIIEVLINLFNINELDDRKIPNYYIPYSKQATELDKEIYPNGCLNFSLSHGISGPLFVLLKAKKYNFSIEGLDEAIEKGVRDICKFAHKNNVGKYNFSGRISLESFLDNKVEYINNRASWCYGNPGMVKIIYEANRVIRSQEIDSIVSSSLDFVLNFPEYWELDSPIICHGYGSIAVLLQSLLLYQKNNHQLIKLQDNLIGTILNTYDPKSKYGFFDIKYVDGEKKQKIKNGEVNIDNIVLEKEDSLCFLTGSLGIILILINSFEIKNKIWLQKICMDKIF